MIGGPRISYSRVGKFIVLVLAITPSTVLENAWPSTDVSYSSIPFNVIGPALAKTGSPCVYPIKNQPQISGCRDVSFTAFASHPS